jgi:hypothetical protein
MNKRLHTTPPIAHCHPAGWQRAIAETLCFIQRNLATYYETKGINNKMG